MGRMLISQLSLETHSINRGRSCELRLTLRIRRILITQLSLERRGWALLSSPLKPPTCIEIVVANSEVKLGLGFSRMLITPLSLQTHSIH
jgi:hypothetical protein